MTWQRRFIDGRMQTVYVQPPAQLPEFVFGEQRKTCERCAWHDVEQSSSGITEVRCTHGGRKRMPCSVARLPDGICGPAAAKFKAKEAP